MHPLVSSFYRLRSLFRCLFYHWYFRLFHLPFSLSSNLRSRTASRPLPVGGNVERDEEYQVGTQDNNSGDGGSWVTRAGAYVWEIWGVSASEVIPRCEINETLVCCQHLNPKRMSGFTYLSQ